MTSSRRTCSSVERLGLRECATIRRSLADRHVGSIAISGTTAESGSSPRVTSPGVVGFRSSRSGQFSDHADMSSGVVTCPSVWVVVVVIKVMDRSLK